MLKSYVVQAAQVRKTCFASPEEAGKPNASLYSPDTHPYCTIYAGTRYVNRYSMFIYAVLAVLNRYSVYHLRCAAMSGSRLFAVAHFVCMTEMS